VFSSRRIERGTFEDVAFRFICNELHPHFTRIAAFRREHRVALEGLFLQVLKLCQRAGLVKLGHLAVDGSKIQGNASKHKAMSYKRMEALDLRLTGEIQDLLERAEAMDSSEDARFGSGQREEDLPEELRRREQRRARLREAKQALEAEAKQARAQRHRELAQGCRARASAATTSKRKALNETLASKHDVEASELDPRDDDDDEPPFTTPDGLPKHRTRTVKTGKPHPNAQRSFTDPDSKLMESGGVFLQGFNCQAAVDDAHQIIVAQSLTNQPPDAGNLTPMLDLVRQNVGTYPVVVSADSGYWNERVAEDGRERNVEVLIATERQRHWDADRTVTEGPPPPGLDARQRMRWKLRTDAGRALYARRKVIVEPVFGQIKDARGFRRFLLRGLEKVALEWSLLSTTHNLLKLFRAQTAAA
jgi:hypothetical protein